MTDWRRLDGLLLAQGVLQAEVDRLVKEAIAEGADRTALAYMLGISRATLYRRFREVVDGPPELGDSADGQLL